MFSEVLTAISTKVDIDTLHPSHEVVIEGDPELPQPVTIAASIGGCKAALLSLNDHEPRLVESAVRQLCENLGIELVDQDD